MRFPLLIAIILFIVNAFVDVYIYAAIHSCTRKNFFPRLQAWSSVALAGVLIAILGIVGSRSHVLVAMWMLLAYLSIYIVKYVFIVFDALSRLPYLWSGKRWKWMSWTGLGLGILCFLLIWWGVFINRYNIEIVRETVEVPELPKSLDSLKIVQISDIHTGTYGKDASFVAKVVDNINGLHPDLIVFTGDIVNQRSSELRPFMRELSRLKAPLGVYSILGNHDYGDYSHWNSEEDRKADVDTLVKLQQSMGWKMLNNSSMVISKGNDEIVLIGVENIGDPPFRVAGDLQQAYPTLNDDKVKILLSHNPAHWATEIANNPKNNIALTLSGHTHAMQMELFGLSPARFRYPYWGGMYEDSIGHKLYVNIGLGEVGFPARIGANPEITLFTLKSTK